MILNVNQTIQIQILRVGSMSNSSILQIGSAGMIKGLSNNFNTGRFTGPAPEAKPLGSSSGPGGTTADSGGSGSSTTETGIIAPLVPLPALQ